MELTAPDVDGHHMRSAAREKHSVKPPSMLHRCRGRAARLDRRRKCRAHGASLTPPRDTTGLRSIRLIAASAETCTAGFVATRRRR